MNTITYTKFNEKPQFYMDKIVKSDKEYILLKNGKPYLRINPIKEKQDNNPLKDSLIFEGDIISPIDEKWEADS
jgi:hypothetical protein